MHALVDKKAAGGIAWTIVEAAILGCIATNVNFVRTKMQILCASCIRIVRPDNWTKGERAIFVRISQDYGAICAQALILAAWVDGAVRGGENCWCGSGGRGGGRRGHFGAVVLAQMLCSDALLDQFVPQWLFIGALTAAHDLSSADRIWVLASFLAHTTGCGVHFATLAQTISMAVVEFGSSICRVSLRCHLSYHR